MTKGFDVYAFSEMDMAAAAGRGSVRLREPIAPHDVQHLAIARDRTRGRGSADFGAVHLYAVLSATRPAIAHLDSCRDGRDDCCLKNSNKTASARGTVPFCSEAPQNWDSP